MLANRTQEITKAKKELETARTALKEKTEHVKGIITKEAELHRELLAAKTKVTLSINSWC